MSSVYCCVPICRAMSFGTPGVSYHAFPAKNATRILVTDENGKSEFMDRLAAWILKLKIAENMAKYMKVCSRHFREDDYIKGDSFKRRYLKKTAIPTLNLPVEVKNKQDETTTKKAQEFILQNVVYIKEASVPNKILKGESYVIDPLENNTAVTENDIIKAEIDNNKKDLLKPLSDIVSTQFDNTAATKDEIERKEKISGDFKVTSFVDKFDASEYKPDENNLQQNDNFNVSKNGCVYSCRFCARTFRWWSVLAKHIICHKDMHNAFSCKRCEYKCGDGQTLRAHIKEKHGLLNGEKCKKCGKIFYNGTKSFVRNSCTLCGMGGDNRKTGSNSNLMLLCDRCPFTCSMKTTLAQHLQKEHKSSSQQYYVCGVCGLVFLENIEFNRHFVNHLNRYRCVSCGFTSMTKSGLETHIQWKHGSTMCSNDINLTTDDARYSSEVESALKDKPRVLTCSECSTACSHLKELIVHLRRVHGKETSEKSFITKNSLIKRGPVRNELSYQCSYCSYKCRTKLTLLKHFRRLHHQHIPEDKAENCKNSVEPFLCDVCAFTCSDKLEFVSHIARAHKTHFDPIADNEKRKADMKYGNLIKKAKIESVKMEMLQCSRKTYSRKFVGNLKKKVKKVEIDYECSYCQEILPSKYALMKHGLCTIFRKAKECDLTKNKEEAGTA